MVDVVALGEALIDFTPLGHSKFGSKVLEANPGGSPCNMLASVRKFGRTAAFIGKVGNDEFGHFLAKTMHECGINTSHLLMDTSVRTTLAIVHLNSYGERSFSFYRNPGADMMLTADEVSETQISHARIFHFGTVSMTNEPSRQATLKALDIAKNNNITISFDPNLRPTLWKNLNAAKTMIKTGLEFADIVKISNYELEFLFGKSDLIENGKKLKTEYNIKILFITLGKDGAILIKDDIILRCPGIKVRSIDTTGAGDTFCGAVSYKLLDLNKDIEKLTYENCQDILIFANGAAALSTKRNSGVLSAPTLNEVKEFINKCSATIIRES